MPLYSDREYAKIIEDERRANESHKREYLYGLANIPYRHSRCTVTDVCTGWTKAFAEIGALNNGYIVALLGQRGTGKTQMAVQIMRQHISRLRSAFYTAALDIFLSVRDANRTQTSEKQALSKYVVPYLLVIDECQERGETPFEDRMLTYIIDSRYGGLHNTILISNQTSAEFEKSMGSSVLSRMQETGGIKLFNWSSFRVNT